MYAAVSDLQKTQRTAEDIGVACRGLKSLLDIGDIVGVQGGIRRTDKGELSVVATSIEVRPWLTLALNMKD